jgi:hypothetical protein
MSKSPLYLKRPEHIELDILNKTKPPLNRFKGGLFDIVGLSAQFLNLFAYDLRLLPGLDF